MTSDSPFVRPDVQAFLDILAAMNRPQYSDMPIAEARASYVMVRNLADKPAAELPVIRDLTCHSPAGNVALRLYDARAERGPGPLVVFYHGGGFTIGDLESHHNICTEIAAELDLPVVAVDYRLGPEHPFPAAPKDCEAATRWLAESPAQLEREVTGLIPMGDSAGGNLTIVTTQSLLLEPAAVPVIMQVPIYPVCDDPRQYESFKRFGEGFVLTKETIEFFDRSYGFDPADRRAYPALGPIEGLPPTVLATTSLDPLRDSGRAFVAMLDDAGVENEHIECEGTVHNFLMLRQAIPSAQEDLLAILGAAKSMLERIA